MEPAQLKQYVFFALVVYVFISIVLGFVKAKLTKTIEQESDYGGTYTYEAELSDKLAIVLAAFLWPFFLLVKIVSGALWWILK